jgi:hypothetical protein
MHSLDTISTTNGTSCYVRILAIPQQENLHSFKSSVVQLNKFFISALETKLTVGSKVLTPLTMKSMLCSPVDVLRRFGETQCFQHQDKGVKINN